jgi:hypothetical protein
MLRFLPASERFFRNLPDLVRERVGAFFFDLGFDFVDVLRVGLLELLEETFFTLCRFTVTTFLSDSNPRSVLVFIL